MHMARLRNVAPGKDTILGLWNGGGDRASPTRRNIENGRVVTKDFRRATEQSFRSVRAGYRPSSPRNDSRPTTAQSEMVDGAMRAVIGSSGRISSNKDRPVPTTAAASCSLSFSLAPSDLQPCKRNAAGHGYRKP